MQAKRELAKKEGRLLTKKQKEEQRAAEIRKQALIASGVQIEGLQQSSAPTKRPVYANRKKGGAKAGSSTPTSQPQTPAPLPPKELEAESTPAAKIEIPKVEAKQVADDVKSDWDASSDEGEKAAADVKDSWDDPSDEEEAAKPVAKPAPAPTKGMDTHFHL